MAMGRFGQMVGPLVAGWMLSSGFTAGQIMLAIGSTAMIGAAFVVWFHFLMTREKADAGAAQVRIG